MKERTTHFCVLSVVTAQTCVTAEDVEREVTAVCWYLDYVPFLVNSHTLINTHQTMSPFLFVSIFINTHILKVKIEILVYIKVLFYSVKCHKIGKDIQVFRNA